MTRAVVISALLCLSCGASNGADGGPDGGVDPRCEMRIDNYAPLDPVIGDTIDVDGAITKENVSGFESYVYLITGPTGSDPTPRMRFPNDDALIEFDAAVAGTYRVELRGDVDGLSCTDAVLSIYVADPAASDNAFRFRFVPALGHPAPAQDKVFEIPGGAAQYPLNVVGLDNGLLTGGTVQSGGPQAAYVRFTRSFDAAVTEAFSDAGGAVTTRLLAGDYDILVVPESTTVAPAALSAVVNSTANLDLTLPAGDTFTGTVVDGGGQPVVGAQVSLRIDGVPSTVGVTDGAGGFTVIGQAGGATAVTVTPPADSGLPRLELPASAGLVAATDAPLAIAYAVGLTSRTLASTLADAGGGAMAGASATLILRPLAGAGTVTPAGGSAVTASGAHRATVTADLAGAVSALVPEGNYDVIVRSLSGTATLLTVDLTSGEPDPASLQVAAAARVSGRVLAGGVAVEGARVTARPRALLASEPVAGAVAVSGSDGTYTLDLVGGGEYELVLESPVRSLARAVLAGVTAPAAGAQSSVGDHTLEPAIAVSGTVAIPGVSQPGGVTVQVFCANCTGTAAQTPLAEAATAADGSFVVSIPDPDGGS